MRILPAAVLAGCCWLMTVFPADSADAPTDRCARKHSVTIAANMQVRVYRDRPRLDGARIIACHRATGSKTRLGSPFADTLHQFGGRRAIALRGSTVAYTMIVDPQGDEGGPGTELVRVRLPFTGEGAAFDSGPAVSLTISKSTPRDLAAERIFIAPSGTVVLAACQAQPLVYKGCAHPLDKVRIVAAPASAFLPDQRFREPVVLANARGIDPRSLRLSPSGTHAGWTGRGRRCSARLPTA